jgi:WD40 repeat protein
VWDVESETSVFTFTGHNAKVHCLAITPNGECIVSGAEDKLVKIWHISKE